jgi:hypothetical protein
MNPIRDRHFGGTPASKPSPVTHLANAGALVDEFYPACPSPISRRVDQLLSRADLLADDSVPTDAGWWF